MIAFNGVRQLMAHVCQKLTLGAVGVLCGFFCLQQLFLGALVNGDVAKHRDAVV